MEVGPLTAESDEPIIHTTEELARYIESGARNRKPTIVAKAKLKTPVELIEELERSAHEEELTAFRDNIETLVGEITDEFKLTFEDEFLTWKWSDEFRFQLKSDLDFQKLIDGNWISYRHAKYLGSIRYPRDLMDAFRWFKEYEHNQEKRIGVEEFPQRRSFWDWLFGRNIDAR